MYHSKKGTTSMLNSKSRFAKIAMTTPLALGLMFGASGCGSEANSPVPAPDLNVMSQEVKTNIESTVANGIKWYDGKEAFSDSVSIFAMSGEEVDLGKFTEEIKTLDNFVSADSGLDEAKSKVKELSKEMELSTGGDFALDDESLTVSLKTFPLLSLTDDHQFEGAPFTVEVDPDGFENINGAWVQTKDGAVSFIDGDGRYADFAEVSEGLAFTPDGKYFSFKNMNMDEDRSALDEDISVLQTEVNYAAMLVETWLSEQGTEKGIESKNLAKKSNEIFGPAKFSVGFKIALTGNLEGYQIVCTSEKTGAKVVYDSKEGSTDATTGESKSERVTVQELYDEYLGVIDRPDSVIDLVEPDALKLIVEDINVNDIKKDASWSVKDENGSFTVIASLDGKDYKFKDITAGHM